jgi:hypothetical protein
MKKEISKNSNKKNYNQKFYEEEKDKLRFKLLLAIISLFLFLYFFLYHFHNWANSLPIILHFCDHRLCIAYSLIWLFLSVFNFVDFYKKRKNLEDKQEKKEEREKKLRRWLITFLIILIIGIILMNIIPCDNSNRIRFDFVFSSNSDINKSGTSSGDSDLSVETIPCVKAEYPECNGYCSEDAECVAIKKGDIGLCICESETIILNETDDGFDPETRGEIIEISSITGNSSVFKEDSCTSYSNLREYTLTGETSYNTTLVDCREYLGDVFACCENGACVGDCSSYDCEEFAIENGFDNFQGGVWNLGECEEISQDDCEAKPGSFIYDEATYCCVWSCKEILVQCSDSLVPSCDGTCPPNNICISHEGNCLCIPRDFQFCEDSYPECDGYCESGICICDRLGGCYCEENIQCEDSWETGCTGYCNEGNCKKNETIDACDCIIEKSCQDSDGNLETFEQVEIPGTCNDENSYTDYCIDDSKLIEFECSGDFCEEVEWQCKQKCVETPDGAYCT